MKRMRKGETTAAKTRIFMFLVDDTDGKTPETSITISAGELKVSKNGAAWANAAGTWTEIGGSGNGEGGYYYTPTAGELGDDGSLLLKLVKTGVRNNPVELQVVTEDPYVGPNPRGIVVDDALNSATTFETNLAAVTNDTYKAPMLVHFMTGATAGQTRLLAASGAYNGTTKFLTLAAGLTAEPAAGDEFEIIAR